MYEISEILQRIYSENGKEIFPRGGLVVKKGAMVLFNRQKEFITLNRDKVCIPIKEKDCTGRYNLPTIFILKDLE